MNGYRLDDTSDIFVLPTFPRFLIDLKTYSSEVDEPDVFMEIVLQGDDETPANIERLKSALSKIPANLDRSDWLPILLGINATGWESSYDIALEWSKTAPEKFNQREFDRDWKSAKVKSNGVTLGTVYHMAKSYGWTDPSKVIGSSYWSFPSPIAPDELNTARTSPDCIVKDFLYSDVGCIVAQGGTGKTTLVIMFAIHIVLGLPLFGREVKRSGPVLIITAEDSREILVARLRLIASGMCLSESQLKKVMTGVRISDVSGESLKLTAIDSTGVVVISPVVDMIINQSLNQSLSCIFIDPTVSFGVGENRVNDAEQALIVAARRINKALNCCVMYIHHTGKVNGREGSLDQYSGRGGSTLPDGSRMVMVIKALDDREMLALANYELAHNEYGLILAIPKLSYSTPQKDIIIVRSGYTFKNIASVKRDVDEIVKGLANKVWNALESELINERYHSKNSLESIATSFGMSQKEVRQGINYLLAESRVEERKRPNAGEKSKGGAHNYFHPIIKNIDLGSADL